jgi:hypothetical protein
MSFLKSIIITSIAVVMLTSGFFSLLAQKMTSRQHQVKAAFLYNFTQFVEWPASAFTEERSPIVIGVMGDDTLGYYLDELVTGEEINGHPLEIHRFDPNGEIKKCHILFINVMSKIKLKEVLEKTKGESILTVSDMPGFIQKGGMIRFNMVDNKLRFQINPVASDSAELKISSKLLQLAEIVHPE